MIARARSLSVALGATLLALSAIGCGHTESHVAMLRAPQAPTGAPIELYVADQAPPGRPFYDIAIVQAIGFGSEANAEDITHALSDKAGALGCDAVVRVFIDLGYSRAHALRRVREIPRAGSRRTHHHCPAARGNERRAAEHAAFAGAAPRAAPVVTEPGPLIASCGRRVVRASSSHARRARANGRV